MGRKQIEEILISQAVNKSLDKRIVDILLDNFKEISDSVKAKQKKSEELFEIKFAKVKNNGY